MPIHGLFTILQRKQVLNNRCLSTNCSLNFTVSRGKWNKTLQKCGYDSHPQTSLLTPVLMGGNYLGCTGEMLHPGSTCHWTAVQCLLLPPAMPRKEARTKYARELRSLQHFSVPSLVMQWPGKGLGRPLVQWEKAGGHSVSQWECSSDKQGGKRQGVGQSLCSGLGQRGEGRKAHGCDPFSFWTPETPWTRTSFAFSQAKGKHKYTWKQYLGSGLSPLQDPDYPLANPHSFAALAQTPAGFGKHHWSHGLSQAVQHSQQLRSRRGSGTVTSCSQSKSVMERWNIWFQVMERLSAALFFFSNILARLFTAKFKWRTVSQVKQIPGCISHCYLRCLD